jgi:SWI/SNF-related matrix-associated actin-dependent regulator 1 of chromatin subfamily A
MATHPSAYQVTFPFGKYKGRSLGEIYHVDRSYLTWVVQTPGMPKTWKELCQSVLDEKPVNAPIKPTASIPIIKPSLVARRKNVGVSFSYDRAIIDRLKMEIDGAHWDNENTQWVVSPAQLPRLVEMFGGKDNVVMDAKVAKWFKEEIERRTNLDIIRVKADTELEIKTLLPLFPYQKVAVEFIKRANGRAMDADQMGLGKTATAIGFAVLENARTLVICPKSVKLNWAREILRFAGKKACIWNGQGVEEGHKNASFHIVNYDNVAKHADEFRSMGFDLLICDEATYIKNYKSSRTKAICGYWNGKKQVSGIKTKYVILLTGTPILNRPNEAFTLLSFIDKSRFSNPKHFMLRYFDVESGQARNLDELFDRTKDLVIRRLKSQVASELPPKQRFDLVVEMSDTEYKAYSKALDKLFSKWKLSGRPSAAHMPEIRNLLFEYKWPRAIEFIDEMLESGRPILVFSIHQAHAYRFQEHYGDICGVITGNESQAEREKVINGVKSGKIKIASFTIGAGGMGIDGLQETMDAVLFVDRWFVPAIHEQAEDRTHRKGQKNQVQVWYMTVTGSFDEVMADLLARKQEVIDQAIDGAIFDRTMGQSFFKEFVKQLAKARKEGILWDDVDEGHYNANNC